MINSHAVKVSVIIPVKNGEKYISQCVESVITQTLSNIEIICVDDASTDRTPHIIKEYRKKDSRIHLIEQANMGPGFARNKGIKCSKGKYVCMMDADDYYPNERVLEKLFQAAEEHHVLICGGNISLLGKDNNIVPSKWNYTKSGRYNSIEKPCLYGQTRFLFNKDFLIKNSIFYPPIVRYEDPPFLLEALLKAKEYFVILDEVYVYRVEYKKPVTDLKIARGLLRGLVLCAELAQTNCLEKSFILELYYTLFASIEYIHPYLYSEDVEIWKCIRKINKIFMIYDIGGNNPFFDIESYKLYVSNTEKQFERYKTSNRIIIYGAGKVAESFLESEYVNKKDIIGIAITNRPEKKEFKGYPLKSIDEYKEDLYGAEIIIAVSEKSENELKDKLRELRVDNYTVVTATKLKIENYLREMSNERTTG